MITSARRRIVWLPAAEIEIADAAVWYENQQPQLGDRFLTAVGEAASTAASSPDMYARVRGELRRVLVHRFPYALIFRESVNELLVVACYHLHRDPSVWESRG